MHPISTWRMPRLARSTQPGQETSRPGRPDPDAAHTLDARPGARGRAR